MPLRSLLPLTATIPPGATVRVTAKPRAAFRVERLSVSPQSFPLSLARRAWTWGPVTIGNALGRLHHGLARLLHVDLYASHERREYVSHEYARAHAEEVSWEYAEDEIEDRPFILVPIPLNRRERLLTHLGRAATHLSRLRLHWQQTQLATLFICNITVAKRPQFVDRAAPLPADLFATPSIDPFVNFNVPSCTTEQTVEIDVHNGGSRVCQLTATLIGTSPEHRIRVLP